VRCAASQPHAAQPSSVVSGVLDSQV
jgi:hypothetical protein